MWLYFVKPPLPSPQAINYSHLWITGLIGIFMPIIEAMSVIPYTQMYTTCITVCHNTRVSWNWAILIATCSPHLALYSMGTGNIPKFRMVLNIGLVLLPWISPFTSRPILCTGAAPTFSGCSEGID